MKILLTMYIFSATIKKILTEVHDNGSRFRILYPCSQVRCCLVAVWRAYIVML